MITVLLIEDDPTLQTSTTRMLRRLIKGAVVHVVDSPKRAIAMLESFVFDLVVSDYDIIDGTGGDVLAWLRAAQHPSLASFVFLSGNSACAGLHDKAIEKGTWPAEIAAMLRGWFPHLFTEQS